MVRKTIMSPDSYFLFSSLIICRKLVLRGRIGVQEVWVLQMFQVFNGYDGVGGANQSLPFAVGLCDLIDAAHLTVGHASNDKDNDPWAVAYLSWALVLMPVTISSTGSCGCFRGSCACGDVRVLFWVQFVFNGVLYDVFNQRSPPGELIRLLTDSFLAVSFLSLTRGYLL